MFYKITIIFLFCIGPLLAFAQSNKTPDLQVVSFSNSLLQYQEGGENKGPTIEILNELLKEAQLSASVSFMPWARAYSIAKTTPNTLTLSMFRTPEREEYFYWLIKVSQAARIFISLKNRPENAVDTIEQAKNKLIAVILDSTAHKELVGAGFSEHKNLYIVSDETNMVNLLINDRVDLVYSDPNNIQRILKAMNKGDTAIRYKKIANENQRMGYIALNKDSDEKIVKQLQQAADKFSQTDEYLYLLAK